MVYDPIRGCVRGTGDLYPRRRPAPIPVLSEEDRQAIIESLRKKLKEEVKPEIRDRIDLLQAIADGDTPKPKPKEVAVKRGRLRFMIGLPRSGKSTWANEWVKKSPLEDGGIVFPRVIVCVDNIRLAVTGQRFNRRAERTVSMVKEYMIEALLASGHNVLVDGTHTTRFSIRGILEIDPEAQWTLINTPSDVCKQRAIDTGQPDLLPVIDRIGKQLDALINYGINKTCEEIREEIKARWPKQDPTKNTTY